MKQVKLTLKTSNIPSAFNTDLALYVSSLFEAFEEAYVLLFSGHLLTTEDNLRAAFEGRTVSFLEIDRWIVQHKLPYIITVKRLREGFFVWSLPSGKSKGFLQDLFRLMERTQNKVKKKGDHDQLQATFNQLYQSFAVNIADEFLFSYLLNMMINLVQSEVGAFQIFREKETRFYSMGIREKDVQSFFYQGELVSDFLRKSKDILFVADTSQNADFTSSVSQSGFLKSLIFVPVIQKGSLIGIFYLINKASVDQNSLFQQQDIKLIRAVWVQIGSVISNALLYQTMIEIKEFNEEILENIPAGVLTLAGNGQVLFINQYLRDFLIKIEMSIAELIDFLKKEQLGSFHNKEMILSEDKRLFINVSKRFLQAGHPSGLSLFIISDISAQKQMEKQLLRTEKLAIAGELISGLAHEIKNPLTSMKGFADLMEERKDDPEFIQKFARIIPVEIARLNHLLEQLLSFSKPNLGLTTDVDMKKVVDQVVDILEFNARKNGIRLINEVHFSVLVSGNEELLVQIFMNLILNAIQALMEDENGSKMIKISAEQTETHVKFNIWDNGPGIPKEKQKSIFNPFYTTKPKGTGLGLSITHRLITEHGGEIVVESEKGSFTLMQLLFPLSSHKRRKI